MSRVQFADANKKQELRLTSTDVAVSRLLIEGGKMLSEHAEEILEALWIQIEEKDGLLDVGASRDEPAIEELVKLGLVKLEGNHLRLLEKGKKEAEGAIRRHRLAERLMVDVLQIKSKIMNEVSCRFEHLLHKGLEDNVCILLGHPKVCPHGKPIPPGKCCQEKAGKRPVKIISSLIDLETKERGEVAYLHAKDSTKMQKLISMGALPGVSITLLTRFPSVVFQIGQSQFAVDEEIAKAIYVRVIK